MRRVGRLAGSRVGRQGAGRGRGTRRRDGLAQVLVMLGGLLLAQVLVVLDGLLVDVGLGADLGGLLELHGLLLGGHDGRG